MEKEDIISVQRAQEDVETLYNLLNNNKYDITLLVFPSQHSANTNVQYLMYV